MKYLRRLFFTVVIFFVVTTIGLATPVMADEPSAPVVQTQSARDVIASNLSMIAVNGKPVSPTAHPKAAVGDTITLRANLRNNQTSRLYDVLFGADWGDGLRYAGNLKSRCAECVYDKSAKKIRVKVADLAPSGNATAPCWYDFDLQITSRQNLYVNLDSDELYACQTVKRYGVGLKINTPELQYTVSPSPLNLLNGVRKKVAVTIKNTGTGTASNFKLDTDLERVPVTVSGVSANFAYDARTGVFTAEAPMKSGASAVLTFDAQLNTSDAPSPAGTLLFKPSYANDCGMVFHAPLRYVPFDNPPLQSELQLYLYYPDKASLLSDDRISYELVLKVPDPDLLTGPITVTHNVPAAVDEPWPYIESSIGNVAVSGHTSVTWTVSPRDAHNARLTIIGKLSETALKNHLPENRAVAKATDRGGRALSVNASRISVINDVEKQADLVVTVTPTTCRLVSPEDPVTWDIYVTNRGTGKAKGVRLYNVLGQDLVFQSARVDDGSVTAEVTPNAPSDGRTQLLWRLGDIEPSHTRRVTVTASPQKVMSGSHILINPNMVYVKVGNDDGKGARQYGYVEAPSFRLPKACITGDDIFEEYGQLHASLGVTQIYKDNLYRTDTNEEEALITYLTPSIRVSAPASRRQVNVNMALSSATPGGLGIQPVYKRADRTYQAYLEYSPRLELYDKHSDYNEVTHQLSGCFQYDSLNKLSVRLLNQFNRSHDSESSRSFNIDDKYKNNVFNMVSLLDLTEKLQLRADYTNHYMNYDASRNDGQDRMDNSGSFYGFFRLTPKTSLFAEYEVTDIDYDDNDMDSRENRYFGGIRWQITEKSSGRIKCGYGKKTYDNAVFDDVDTWMAEIALGHQLTSKTSLAFEASRHYDENMGPALDVNKLPSVYYTNILTQLAGLSVSYAMTYKMHLKCYASVSTDSYDTLSGLAGVAPPKDRRDKIYNVSPSLQFNFNHWLALNLSYTYSERDSNYSQNDYTDNTVVFSASTHY